MQVRNLLFLGLGLLVGGGLILVLRGGCAPAGLVDGKYLVVQSSSGHWIYEAGPDGIKLLRKELSPEGFGAIWGLQSAYQPKSMVSGGEELVHLPNTAYSMDTGQFQVVHKFYRAKEGKLVEVPMGAASEPK